MSTNRRQLPTRTAAIWLWVDMLTKHPIGLLFVLCAGFVLVAIMIAWWPIILAIAVVLSAWRMWLRHVERSRARGTIPYGKLGTIEWIATRLIGIGESMLRRHNLRRKK